MPFQAEGQVFIQAQRMDDDTARLILIDPGFLDPADHEVTLHVRGYSALRDLLSGESVGMENGQARLTVPAGAFVLLEAKR